MNLMGINNRVQGRERGGSEGEIMDGNKTVEFKAQKRFLSNGSQVLRNSPRARGGGFCNMFLPCPYIVYSVNYKQTQHLYIISN